MSPRFRLPAAISTPTSAKPIAISYDDDLRRRAHGAEERVLRVRRPAGDDDAVDAHRGHREHVSSPALMFGEHQLSAERDRPPRRRAPARARASARGRTGTCSRLVGTMISLNSSLSTSANGCSRPERADAVRADAHLHPADHLALPQREVGDARGSAAARCTTILTQRPDRRPHAGPSRSLPTGVRWHRAFASALYAPSRP